MSSFYFKAVAADGKLRTGNLSGDNDKAVARELRKQGLNDEIRKLIVGNEMSLREDGWNKVQTGVTTADEVMRVSRSFEMMKRREAGVTLIEMLVVVTIIAQYKKGITGMPTIETASRKVSGANRTNSKMPMKNDPTGLFSKVSTQA